MAYGAMVRLHLDVGTLRDGHVTETIGWYLLAWAGFVLGLIGAERRWRRGQPIPVWWLLAVPIGFRVLLWLTEPTLSDDVYRYLWDGHLVGEGVSPYRHAVSAPQLDGHDVGIRALVNNPDLASPYLPAAQGLFAAIVAVAGTSALAVQIVMTGFDLATAGLIAALLAATGAPRHRVMLYLWNPLVIVETAHGAHLDAFMIALTLAAVATADGDRDRPRPSRGWMVSPLLAAAATLTRPLPVLAVAVIWWRWSGRQRLAYLSATAAIVVAVGLGPGFGLGPRSADTGLFGAARAYTQRWRFNGALFEPLAGLLGSEPAARVALVAILGAATVAVTVNRARARGVEGRRLRGDLRAVAVLYALYVITTPTLHPWYLIGLMAVGLFWAPSRGPSGAEPDRRWLLLVPWLYLGAAISLSYLTYRDPAAHAELSWVRPVEWWPTLALAIGLAPIALRPPPQPPAIIDSDGQAPARPPAVPDRQPG